MRSLPLHEQYGWGVIVLNGEAIDFADLFGIKDRLHSWMIGAGKWVVNQLVRGLA
jgi:hypothetical protein